MRSSGARRHLFGFAAARVRGLLQLHPGSVSAITSRGRVAVPDPLLWEQGSELQFSARASRISRLRRLTRLSRRLSMRAHHRVLGSAAPPLSVDEVRVLLRTRFAGALSRLDGGRALVSGSGAVHRDDVRQPGSACVRRRAHLACVERSRARDRERAHVGSRAAATRRHRLGVERRADRAGTGVDAGGRMKVLVITDHYPPYSTGGYEIACEAVAEGLRRRGHQVRVLTSVYGVSSLDRSDHVDRVLHRPQESAFMPRLGWWELQDRQQLDRIVTSWR